MPNQIILTNASGTLGRNVQLVTNNYRIKFHNNKLQIHQYDLSIVDPDKVKPGDENSVPSKGVCDEIFRLLKLHKSWAYDGKRNLYSPKGDSINRTQELKVGKTTYQVTIQGPVASRSVQDIMTAIKKQGATLPLEAVNALHIVFTQGFKSTSYATVKRCFFKTDQLTQDFPGGLQLYSGISTATTPTADFGITIRVLKSYQIMYPGGPLINFVRENLDRTQVDGRRGGQNNRNQGPQMPKILNKHQIKFFNGILKGIKVHTEHLEYKRKYTITGVHDKNANDTFLEGTDNLSVSNYFLGQYKITLKHPDLPLVKAGGKTKLPMELCTVLPNQPYFTALEPAQQREIIKAACAEPDRKIEDINATAQEVIKVTAGFTKQYYGFEIEPNAVQVKGRILTVPKMTDDKRGVRDGAWTMTAVKRPSPTVGQVKIGIISLSPKHKYKEDLHNKFVKLLTEKAAKMGIGLTNCDIRVSFCKFDDLRATLKKIPQTPNAQLYNFIILDDDRAYGGIKLTERNDLKTQCLRFQTIEKVCGTAYNPRGGPSRPDYNTLENILKKFNTKIGGVNWSINVEGLPTNIFKEPTIIIGADVTHFTRNEKKPSIAAVVATCDQFAGQYISRTKVLYPEEGKQSVEYIRGMKDIIKGILIEFYNRCRKNKPARIIYYRDGVSEGQFENTVMEELGGIQDACTDLHKDYTPKISVVVCTKRHKQRFVVTGPGGAQQRNNRGVYSNMAPGTVIDKGVVSPNYHNFYMCSQQAIKGTCVPCHYYVLYDDNKLSPDMWQMLSFFLCHTYARCSRSVSYPAPIYYAHLACFSARSRMLAKYDWADMEPDNLPTAEEIEKITRPDKMDMFFI